MHPHRHSLPWQIAFIARWVLTEGQKERAERVSDSVHFADDAMNALQEAHTGGPAEPVKASDLEDALAIASKKLPFQVAETLRSAVTTKIPPR